MAKRIHNLQASKIASIEEELRVLKTQMTAHPSGSKGKRFADLEGIWKGAGFTFEEIQGAKLKVNETRRKKIEARAAKLIAEEISNRPPSSDDGRDCDTPPSYRQKG